jgi:hydrogenase 3 maturation protease
VFEDLEILLSQKDKKLLFVGIGNLLKSDDGIGVYMSKKIRTNNHIMALTAEVSIENYIGKINSIKPDILVIIDCMDMKSKPGNHKLFSVNELEDLTFNTHNISLNRLSDFFTMPVFVLGIQPEKIDFGENISYLVRKVANNIILQINKKEVYHGY